LWNAAGPSTSEEVTPPHRKKKDDDSSFLKAGDGVASDRYEVEKRWKVLVERRASTFE
jgi:hypothetical protein